MNRAHLTRFAWLSIGAAIATILLKTIAYWLTGSVGLLSDALESCVNLVGAVVALIMLTIAARPPDEEHEYGHSKAEYFSSGVEGGLILVAAVSIAYAAIRRLMNPVPLEQVGIGLVVSLIASAINFVVSRVLLRAGKEYNSITLEADARHLMTDVWTSVGVIAGVAAVALTGYLRLDPLIALVVAANIVWTGYHLIKRSVLGLMDTALPAEDEKKIIDILEKYRQQGVLYHALLTRESGAQRFVSVHVLVPDEWTVLKGHQLMERIEGEIHQAMPETSVFTHMEPLHDPASFDDVKLYGTEVEGQDGSNRSNL